MTSYFWNSKANRYQGTDGKFVNPDNLPDLGEEVSQDVAQLEKELRRLADKVESLERSSKRAKEKTDKDQRKTNDTVKKLTGLSKAQFTIALCAVVIVAETVLTGGLLAYKYVVDILPGTQPLDDSSLSGSSQSAPSGSVSGTIPPGSYDGNLLTQEQIDNAAALIRAAKKRGETDRATTILLMAAIQESSLINVASGDDWWFGGQEGASDSRGLLQQRSEGWGDETCRLKPECAAGWFLDALKKVDSGSGDMGSMAQKVQGSAFPDAYAPHQQEAEDLLKAYNSTASTSPAIAGTSSNSPMVFPIVGQTLATSTITSDFGQRNQPTAGASTNHMGIDFGAKEGTPVVAIADGIINEVHTTDDNACGLSVGYSLNSPTNDADGARYCHLSEVSVAMGDKVSKGQVIGKVGQTGAATGAHLHFEDVKGSSSVDPNPLLKSIDASASTNPNS